MGRTAIDRPILVCGLEHLLPKVGRRYAAIREKSGTPSVVYSDDASGLSQRTAAEYAIPWFLTPSTKRGDILTYLSLLRTLRPRHIELYHSTQSTVAHVMYVALAKLAQVPVVAVCRGNELLRFRKHVRRRQWAIKFGLKASKLVIYNQLHMPATFDTLGIPAGKRLFFWNRVPHNPVEPLPPKERPGVLFLNTWHAWRHPEVMLEIGLRLAPKYPGVRFILAGDRNHWSDRRNEFRAMIEAAGPSSRVALLPFTDRPEELYRQASIFVLPAEIVFLNFSLLEAMERGVAPVIARADGAERIVEDGISGVIVELNTESFIRAVDSLLSRPDILATLCAGARRQFMEKFDLNAGIWEIIRAYEDRVWANSY